MPSQWHGALGVAHPALERRHVVLGAQPDHPLSGLGPVCQATGGQRCGFGAPEERQCGRETTVAQTTDQRHDKRPWPRPRLAQPSRAPDAMKSASRPPAVERWDNRRLDGKCRALKMKSLQINAAFGQPQHSPVCPKQAGPLACNASTCRIGNPTTFSAGQRHKLHPATSGHRAKLSSM